MLVTKMDPFAHTINKGYQSNISVMHGPQSRIGCKEEIDGLELEGKFNLTNLWLAAGKDKVLSLLS
jgi:hypothetical protein